MDYRIALLSMTLTDLQCDTLSFKFGFDQRGICCHRVFIIIFIHQHGRQLMKNKTK